MAATSSYKTYLMLGTTSNNSTTYSKLIDIKNYPDLGSAPELLETTTLSDAMRTNIFGIQGNDAMEFTCNYSKTDYATVAALAGTEQDLAIYFGDSGADGKFTFKGYVSVHANGADVNAVREMTVTVAASTPITVA